MRGVHALKIYLAPQGVKRYDAGVGASIYYQPVKGKHLSIGAPSSFLEALREALDMRGGHGELRLTGGDYHRLRGLRAGLTSTDQKEAIDELCEAIEKHDEVRLWAEY